MSAAIKLIVNGKPQQSAAAPDTPLLYILRNDLELSGPRFGCGLAQCGACTVHVDGAPARSCVTPLSAVAGKRITTLEGLAAGAAGGAALHPVQQAFIDEQAAQCGYCINGWIMTAAALLKENPNRSDAELRAGLGGLKCRCGTHMSILRAVKRAARQMAKA
jgi:aerobic-type carbon monoxide dehydrogenase small subunit (CoxS/CutS family)